MTGSIKFTNTSGGKIKPDNGSDSVTFLWADCEFGPSDIGHGVMVEFFIEVVRGRDRAIGVRRLESETLCRRQ
jgi:hypothetical protein